MNKTTIALALALILGASPAFSGTDKDTGTVCQGSTCNTGGSGSSNGGGAGGSVGDVTNRNVNSNANRNSNRNTNKQGQAQGQGQLQGQAQGQSLSNRNKVSGVNTQSQSTSSRASSNSDQSQGQNQSLGNVNDLSNRNGQAQALDSEQANSQSMTYNEAKQDYSNTYEDYTPNAAAYAAPPSATCVITGGAAVNLPGFSGSASGGVIDQICQALEIVRSGRTSGSVANVARAEYLYTLVVEDMIAEFDNSDLDPDKDKPAKGTTKSGVFGLTDY